MTAASILTLSGGYVFLRVAIAAAGLALIITAIASAKRLPHDGGGFQ